MLRKPMIWLACLVAVATLMAGCASSSVVTAEGDAGAEVTDTAESVPEAVDAPTTVPGAVETDDSGDAEPAADQADESTGADPGVSGSVEAASLAVSSAQALTRVGIVGLDPVADVSTLRALTTIQGENLEYPVFQDDVGLYVLAPLVAEAPEQAAQVELQLTDGDTTGPVLLLTVEGLPAAPDAAAEYVDSLKANLDRTATALGSSYDELASLDLADLTGPLFAAKASQLIIDDGTANDITSWLLGDGDRLAEEQALIDAIVGYFVAAQSAAIIADTPAENDGEPKPTPEPTPIRNYHEKTTKARPLTNTASSAKIAGVQSGGCASTPVIINTPGQLATALATGISAKQAIGGAAGRVLSDITTALGVGSAIPGFVGIGSGVISASTSAYLISVQTDLAQYPSTLDQISLDVSETEFDADFTSPGEITSIDVVASSTGGGVGGDLLGFATGVGTLGGSWQVSLASTVVTNVGASALNESSAWCPNSWTIDIAESDLYDIETVQGGIDVDRGARTFSPTELGTAIIRVEVSIAGLNIGQAIQTTTNPLGLVVSPSRVELREPGEQVDLALTFINSETEVATWETTAGSLSMIDTEGEVTNTLTTPGDSSQYPILVSVETTATTGLYALDSPPEQAVVVATITVSDLIIDPAGAVVGVGRSVQYTARNRSGEVVDVQWQATGGSIDANGLFTAGETTGEFSVSATLVGNASVAASVPVTVVDNSCTAGQWSLRVAPWMEQVTQLFGELSGTGGAMEYVGGEYLLSIDEDGNFETRRVDLTFRIVAQGQSLVMNIDSLESGTVAFEPDLDQSDPPQRVVGTATVVETFSDATVRFLGIERNVSTPSGFSGNVVYECDGDVFSATADGATSTWDRIGSNG